MKTDKKCSNGNLTIHLEMQVFVMYDLCFVLTCFRGDLQVIFSQSSDIIEPQSSMCSSNEEMSPNEVSLAESKIDHEGSAENQFGVFRDFDFLDIELESAEVRATSHQRSSFQCSFSYCTRKDAVHSSLIFVV